MEASTIARYFVRSPRVGVIKRSYKLSDASAEKWPWVFWRAVHTLNHWAISLAPQKFSFKSLIFILLFKMDYLSSYVFWYHFQKNTFSGKWNSNFFHLTGLGFNHFLQFCVKHVSEKKFSFKIFSGSKSPYLLLFWCDTYIFLIFKIFEINLFYLPITVFLTPFSPRPSLQPSPIPFPLPLHPSSVSV